MKEPGWSSDYAYSTYVRGDYIVVEDLSDADYSYAEGLDCFELRRKGRRLGRFESLEDAKAFLEGEG